MIPMILLLLGGFVALYFGADWMVRGAARVQKSFGLSPIVIGLTVVSLGTSAPELFVCLLATLQGNADIAVGNVLGSNLANLGLILGGTALVRPLLVADRVARRDIPIMILLTLVLCPLIIDRQVGRLDGLFLTALMAGYIAYVFHRVRKARVPLPKGYVKLVERPQAGKKQNLLVSAGLLIAGTLGLLMGGRAIVESAVYLSRSLGISELGVGLTIVAIGTSLPELATSLLAALRRETDIAVGNVIGSNIFNIVGVIGVTGAIEPIAVDPGVLWVEFPAVVALSVLAWAVAFAPRSAGPAKIQRWEGFLLLAGYVGLGFWIL